MQPSRTHLFICQSGGSRWRIFRLENVPGLITAESGQFLRTLLWQFAQMGFDVEWGIVSAASVGAVHLRERVWIIAHSQSSRRGTSWSQYTQERTNAAFVSCGNHCNFQRSSQSDNSVEYGARAIAQRTSCGGDDGFPARLDGCLLTHTGLTDWLTAATIPSFNRLTRNEVAALTPNCQKEYRQLYAEYLAIRRQQTEQIKALGNAIVPQCAALIFERLKRILSQQQKNS
jgi:DNA (cytosine-5)-methyltransferase 1